MNRTVDIAIPVLNEIRYIRACLDSVLNFELPEKCIVRIYVLDGGSTDNTRALAREYASHNPHLTVLDNPGRIQSCALNLVIRQAHGEYLLRLDAHSVYPPDYLRLCLETSERTGAENVGGIVVTLPGGDGVQAKLVQALTTHRFGVGNSAFRVGAKEHRSDTVPYGFFRRAIFGRIGLYDERLVRAQDYEINRRIGAAGGTVWLNPAIRVQYHNQPTLAKFYKKQILDEAPYNSYLWWVAPYAFAWRHAITGLFSAGVLAGICLAPLTAWIKWPFIAVISLYVLLALTSSLQQAARFRSPMHAVLLPPCFFLYHFLHGLGVLWGLIRLLTHTAPVQKMHEPWPGAGRYRAWPPSSGRL